MVTIGAFAAIAVASVLGGPWAGVPVTVVLAVAATFFYLKHGRAERRPQTAPRSRSAADERRILVIANETVGGEKLRECIRQKSEGARGHVLVVSPALNSPLRHWAS